MKNVIVDTSALLDGFDIFDCDTVWIVATVADELDAKKRDKNTNLAKSAQRAIKDIYKAQERGIVKFRDKFTCSVPFDMNEPDNKILAFAKEILTFDQDAVLVSSDYCMLAKAKSIDISCKKHSPSAETLYTGMFEVSGTADAINTFFQDIEDGHNSNGLLENQYVIVKQEGSKPSEYRYNKGKLTRLKLPDVPNLKPMNSQQRCAMDMLLDDSIKIVILSGSAGSGKSILATRIGLHLVRNKGYFGKFLMLRNPIGSGEPIGFLSGTQAEKTASLYKCMQQHLETIDAMRDSKNKYSKKQEEEKPNGIIEQDIPYYVKGMSYGGTYVLFDEAEDANFNLLCLIGERIEEDSKVVFTGDFDQTETKFKKENALIELINSLKGNPLVGICVLDECVRSHSSKVFADLMKNRRK